MNVGLFAGTTDNGLGSEVVRAWDAVVTFLAERSVELSLNLLAALVIFVVGRWVAKLLRRIVVRLMGKADVDETLAKFLSNIVYTLLLVLVVLAAVDRLGVDTTSFAAVVAAAGFAVGFALKDSLGNFAAGVMLILFKPFRVGDFVEVGGSKGIVETIHIFSTLMRTGDNVQIIIPNGQITGAKITNYSVKETRRIELAVGCSYDDDLKAVKEFLKGLLAADGRVLEDPEPIVAVNELGGNKVNFIVWPWVKRTDYGAVRWDLMEKIKTGFDERGFNIR